jgi:hypothetical protein
MIDISALNWPSLINQLNETGYVSINGLLTQEECRELIDGYSQDHLYRNTIDMQRYRFGKGEYRYYNYPLPGLIAKLRRSLYPHLAAVANEWMQSLERPVKYPPRLNEFLDQCHKAGQIRPTPLILRYEAGGFNTLHQDLYGDVYFPFQVVIPLTESGKDHEGGESVFVEQLPRAQSKATVIVPHQGDAAIFTTNFRPVKGTRGWYKAKMKHGISPVTRGTRYACGIIFHDAA